MSRSKRASLNTLGAKEDGGWGKREKRKALDEEGRYIRM